MFISMEAVVAEFGRIPVPQEFRENLPNLGKLAALCNVEILDIETVDMGRRDAHDDFVSVSPSDLGAFHIKDLCYRLLIRKDVDDDR